MAPPPTLAELIETIRRDSGTDKPLDQLVTAAAAAAQLEETTDALLGYFVDRCRRDGRSWTEISAALGVTKQAVHKRFAGAVADQIIEANPAPTFERFTDRARRVVIDTQTVAAGLGDDFVAPEHILLALFGQDALAARALAIMEVTQEQVRDAIAAARNAEAAGSAEAPGSADTPGSADAAGSAASAGYAASVGSAAGRWPFTTSAKRVLREALSEALRFGHNYIGTEHLLLGLYADPDSLAAKILTDAGAAKETARAHITDLLRSMRQPASQPPGSQPGTGEQPS